MARGLEILLKDPERLRSTKAEPPSATARTGLTRSGRKKVLPSRVMLTAVPNSMSPAPTSAPVRAWVVEMGKPVRVAANTVSAAPSATTARNSGWAAAASGTSPFAENAFTSLSATTTERSEPAIVVTVAPTEGGPVAHGTAPVEGRNAFEVIVGSVGVGHEQRTEQENGDNHHGFSSRQQQLPSGPQYGASVVSVAS